MPLTPGTRLGVYEVTEQIGAGGMGEVYRATDTKLKRQVAIKILPPSLASDHDRLARFQREAEVLASLNHPHIAGIYGLEESGGMTALVMELIEGEDLSQRIARGALPLDEALPIAKQIAEALEAAHEQGIIHRDLKPANIKVRGDGIVKVLDFGLAKAMEPAGVAPNVSQSPTITTPAMTMRGVILGTAAYMAPEQARGKTVDKRADIWAFGCVLYEMLTGKRTFQCDDVTDTIAFVLTREPDWAALPQSTPPAVNKMLRRCLQKESKQRLQHIGDARIELEESNAAPTVGRETSRRFTIAAVFSVGLGLGLLVAALVRSSSSAPAGHPVEQLSMLMPSDATLREGPSVAISRDGRRVAYVAEHDGVSRLFVRDLAQADGRVLVETGQPWMPFFSPDGESIGFFASGKLQRVAVSGGTPLVLCDAPYALGGTWGADDLIVFAPTVASALLQISANGGTPKPLTSLDKENGIAGHRWPQLLPGNRAVLFAAGPAGSESNFNEARIEVQSLETGEHHVISRGTYPRYASSGHLLYVDNDTILARRFDVKALAAVGASVPVLEHVDAGAAGQKPFDISVNGTVAYAPGLPELPQPLFVVDVTGAMRPLPFAPARFRQPRVSPDGQHLVVGVVATDADLWVYDITNGARTRITSGGSNRAATWTHDGRRVIYAATRSATTSIYRRSADASTPEEKLISIGALPQSVSLSPDDHTLLFNTPNDTTGATSFRVDLTDAQHPRQWVNSPSGEEFITVSPDGERVAYVSNQSGRPEVYVRPSSDKGGGVQVSIATGRAPVWAHGGRELFFLDSQRGLLMAARVTSKPILTVGVPRRIMSSGSAANLDIDAYDVMPDDRHFVIVRNNANSQHELSIITNWTEELKARVPTK